MQVGDESIGVHMIANNGKNNTNLDKILSFLLVPHRCNQVKKKPTINKPAYKKPIPTGM